MQGAFYYRDSWSLADFFLNRYYHLGRGEQLRFNTVTTFGFEFLIIGSESCHRKILD